jgi:hypothetical protein
MVIAGRVMGIKNVKPEDVETLRMDVLSLLHEADSFSSAFKVQRPDDITDGTLSTNGKWKDLNGRPMSGIHTLLAHDVPIQMSTIATAIVSEQITFAMMERENKKKAIAKRKSMMGSQGEGEGAVEEDPALSGALRCANA